MATPECVEVVTLRQCTDKLATGISLELIRLANKLFQESLVSESLVEIVHSGQDPAYDKATKLVNEVRSIVGVSHRPPEKFEVFLNALNESTLLQDIVKLVRKKYKDNIQAQEIMKVQVAPWHIACDNI